MLENKNKLIVSSELFEEILASDRPLDILRDTSSALFGTNNIDNLIMEDYADESQSSAQSNTP